MQHVETHREIYDVHYRTKFEWFRQCIYCGEPAHGVDHVWPIIRCVGLELARPSVRREMKQGLNRVPCCAECNLLAGARPFRLIREKRAFIHALIARKYKRLCTSIIWDEDDLQDIGRNLRSKIVADMNKAIEIRRRLAWPDRADLKRFEPYIRWRTKQIAKNKTAADSSPAIAPSSPHADNDDFPPLPEFLRVERPT